jgi:hypothetical protein
MKKELSLVCVAFCLFAYGDVAFDVGRWNVSFKDKGELLTLSHKDGNASINGKLSFIGPSSVTGSGIGKDEKMSQWRVVSPRDGATRRLALVDTIDNVNGYVTFQSNGEEVSLLVYHRTAFAYEGTLKYDASVKYRSDAYPCSLTPKKGEGVLTMKSGPIVLSSDDALYSPSTDEAMQIAGCKFTNVGTLGIVVNLSIAEPSENTISFKIVKGWYKNRWVPYWRPLDRTRAPHAPTGWLSWNTYFDTAGSKENLDEARFAAKYFKPFGMEIWNIESWQDNSPKLPVAHFHNMNLETYAVQFPEGMKWLADEIRKLGFKPGLWMAPFGTGNTKFYEEHRDWFLHDEKGNPIRCWNGRYTLDPSVKAAREHLKNIFDKASHDWGYEFFKIDGMSGRSHGYCAHLYERPYIRARFADPKCPNPFELCVKAFREGIGEDRIFLACQGHFTGAEAAYADASRTGADIVHPLKPVMWENILLQARCTINQSFAHANVFWSDPDCMLISQAALEREQAQVETTVVALPGQQTFAGDKLAELAPDRVKLIQQALPVCETRPARLYPQFGHLPIWHLAVERSFGSWHIVALFNWDDNEKRVGVNIDELGVCPSQKFIGWEFWTSKFLGEVEGRIELPVPPRSVRLVALQPNLGRPQFLTSDRHITQGAVGLEDIKWDGSRLTASISAVAGFSQVLRFAMPKDKMPSRVTAVNATVKTSIEFDGAVVAVEVLSQATGTVNVSLEF